MILGIDVGYSQTKVYTKRGTDIFLSTKEEGSVDINKNSTVVEFEGKVYTIGSKTGTFSVDLNKINDLTFKLCLYTAIAKQMKGSTADIELVTGLPVEYYENQKDQLMESLRGTTVNIVLNGKPKRFTITKCIVFPQSAGLFMLNPEQFEDNENIIVDIGGLTVDVSLFDNMDLIRTATYELGTLKLYHDLAQKIKSEYAVSYDTLQMEKVIKNKEIRRDNEIIDITDLIDTVLSRHADKIINSIKNGFKEYSTTKRTFIGGGSYLLRDYLNIDLRKEDIFTNAKAFFEIGVESFEG